MEFLGIGSLSELGVTCAVPGALRVGVGDGEYITNAEAVFPVTPVLGPRRDVQRFGPGRACSGMMIGTITFNGRTKPLQIGEWVWFE